MNNNQRINMVGRRAGRLLIVEYSHSTRAGGRYWKCKCDCGKEVVVRGAYLRKIKPNGLPATYSCGCSKELQKRGAGDILGAVWNSIRNGARERNMELSVTVEEAWSLYKSQQGKCALTGVELILPTNVTEFRKRRFTASLDRINSSRGYVTGNVQWVHKHINMMKQGLNQHDFIMLCSLVHNHNKGCANDNGIGNWLCRLPRLNSGRTTA